MSYQVRDELFLWWLAQPTAPALVGSLRTARVLRGVSLQYDEAWLKMGHALSEDLPLIEGEQFPSERDSAAGAVDDARPDRWGERVIRYLDRPRMGCFAPLPRHPAAERPGSARQHLLLDRSAATGRPGVAIGERLELR